MREFQNIAFVGILNESNAGSSDLLNFVGRESILRTVRRLRPEIGLDPKSDARSFV